MSRTLRIENPRYSRMQFCATGQGLLLELQRPLLARQKRFDVLGALAEMENSPAPSSFSMLGGLRSIGRKGLRQIFQQGLALTISNQINAIVDGLFPFGWLRMNAQSSGKLGNEFMGPADEHGFSMQLGVGENRSGQALILFG